MSDFNRGDLCVWFHTPKGGHGYVSVVPCVFMERGPKKIRIAVRMNSGVCVYRWVRANSIERAGNAHNVELAKQIRETVSGDWERKRLKLAVAEGSGG